MQLQSRGTEGPLNLTEEKVESNYTVLSLLDNTQKIGRSKDALAYVFSSLRLYILSLYGDARTSLYI